MMKNTSEHFVNMLPFGDEMLKSSDDGDSDFVDPLGGLGDEVKEPQYYKLDDVVFAEPLNCEGSKESSNTGQEENESNKDEIKFIDNVIVQKLSGRKNKKYHINIENHKKPICPQPNCSKEFSTVTLLKAHIRRVHCSERSYICSRCGAAHAAEYLLQRHLLVHASDRERCPVCSKTFSLRTNLTVHLRTHTNTRPHKCVTCNKSFVRKATLNLHVKFVHRSGDVECEKCHAKFKSRSEWSRHKSTHRGGQ